MSNAKKSDEVSQEHPQFLVQKCDCGKSGCDSIVFAMLKPVIVPVEGRPEELAAMVYFPKDSIPALVIQLMQELD